MRLKTYESFFDKDYRPELVRNIASLTKKIFDTEITIREIESAFQKRNKLLSKVISIRRKIAIDDDNGMIIVKYKNEQWCHINYEYDKEMSIWFNTESPYILGEFILSILLKFGAKISWGAQIINNDIPEIIKELTIENYEEFEATKKYNL